MSLHEVAAGRRLQVTSAQLHKAGDLVYYMGYYGTVQDDVKVVGDLMTIIMEGVWNLKWGNGAVGTPPGTKVYAYPTTQATTLQVFGSAASGANPVGRMWASSATGYVKTQLFNPNAY
jgi:hypothetical protein